MISSTDFPEIYFRLILIPRQGRTRVMPNFAFLENFELTPQLDSVNLLLNHAFHRCARADKIDPSLHYDTSSTETTATRERYVIMPFSAEIFTHHILRPHYRIRFSSQLPWPVHRLYVNHFYPSGQLASSKGNETWTSAVLIWKYYLAFDGIVKAFLRKTEQFISVYLFVSWKYGVM